MDPFEPTPEEPSPEPLRPEDPHWSLAPIYLAFRPKVFFQTFALQKIPSLVALAAWTIGMYVVIDRFETKMLTGSSDSLVQTVRSSWSVYWLVVIFLGAFAGVMRYAIGGWWYRVRIKWSGATDPDPDLARRVYLFAAQVIAIPGLLVSAWDSFRFDNPGQAYLTDKWTDWLFLVLIFWTIYVSYRGVRTAFDVVRWKARLWFAILPGMLYGVFLAAMFIAGFAGALVMPPDLNAPQALERGAFALEYPGNWNIDTTADDYEPDSNFTIEPFFADAVVNFWFYVEPMSSQMCVDQTLANMEFSFKLEELFPIVQWGEYAGVGYETTAHIEGGKYFLLMFCSTEQDTPFEVMVLSQESAYDKLKPGFEHVETTFRLESGKPVAVPDGEPVPDGV